MKRSSALAGFALVLGLIVMLSIFSLWGIDLPGVLAAPTGTGPWYVSTTGNDSNTCLGSGDAAACRTISNAISLASSGDVINIAAGAYSEHLTVTKSLAFIGAGANSTFIDGGNAGRVFSVTISGTAFSDLTIQNGRVISQSGAGIFAWGTLTLTNVNMLSNTVDARTIASLGGGGVRVYGNLWVTGGRFENNSALVTTINYAEGGAIRSSVATGLQPAVWISGAVFINNTSDYGGAISAAGLTWLTNTLVISNIATRHGGGVYINTTSAFLTLNNAIFERNSASSASRNGGGVYFGGDGISVTDSWFISNRSASNGGGLYIAANVTVTGSHFISNTAGTGGGFYTTIAATVTGSQFTSNTAVIAQGGGFYSSGAVTVTNAVFISNTGAAGGGFHCNSGVAVIVTNAVFTNNTAFSSNGGGFYNVGSSTVTDAQFHGNTSGGAGGGIFSNYATTVTNVVFTSNTAGGSGGGLAANQARLTDTTTVSGTQFISNTSGGNGGGFNTRLTSTLTNTVFLNNTSLTNGGGAFAGDAIMVAGAQFISNTAGSGGGMYANKAATLTNTVLISNSAITNGGGFYSRQAVIIHVVLTSNTAGSNGGGLYANNTATVTDAQFISNSASFGGGVYLRGGVAGNSSLINVLLQANSAVTNGAALYLYGSDANGGSITIIHTTIASPTVGAGQAIYVDRPATKGVTVTITDTIVANYISGIVVTAGVTITSDYNLLYNAPTAIIIGSHSITDDDPLFADPAGGDYHLTEYSPAVDTGTNAGVTVDMEGNSRPYRLGYDIGAYESPYTGTKRLLVEKAGVGDGDITSDPEGLVCGITCTAHFIPGTVVTLTVSPQPGSTFDAWSGACSGSGRCVVTMSANTVVTATFTAVTNVLEVTLTGAGSGEITSTPAGISCAEGICSHDFISGTVVTLTASAPVSSTFSGWSGACSGAAITCVVTMSETKAVTAEFALKTYTLTVSLDGTGSGEVCLDGVVCVSGEGAENAYDYGTVVELTAEPSITSTFDGWTLASTPNKSISTKIPLADCSDTGACRVTITESKSITATFSAITNALEVTLAGTGGGVITSTPAGINCPAGDCASDYVTGTVVTLKATPLISSTFSGWTQAEAPVFENAINVVVGGCSGVGDCVLTMTETKTVTATFEIITFTLTPTAGANGSITPNLPQTVNHGTSQAFTITANTGYHITDVGVDGVSQGVITTYTFSNITASHAISAEFMRSVGPWYVSTTGNDADACTSWGTACRTISNAIAIAIPGDVIYIDVGTYTERMTVTKSLSFIGAGADSTFIDGNNTRRVFNITAITDTTFLSLTIQNGFATDNGGGIYAGGILTLTNVNFLSNTAGFSGGGLYANSPVTVTGGLFIRNTAINEYGSGGGFYANSTATVSDTEFTSNTAGYSGGGFYAAGAVIATNVWFTSNSVPSGYGGGLYASDKATVTGAHFISNSARYGGGGLYVIRPVTVTNSQFTGNSAPFGYGGGLYAFDKATVTGTHFISNSARYTGGGLYADKPVTVNGTQFISNTSDTGGGLYAYRNAAVTGTHFISNTASDMGGGLYAYTTATVADSKFTNNTASFGGGVYVADIFAGDSSFINVLFQANTAQWDGAAIFLFHEGGNGGNITILHSTIVSPSLGTNSAVFVSKPKDFAGVVGITNTIVASYTTGIKVMNGVSTTSDYNLFYNAPTTITIGSHSITGTDPLFVDAVGGDYHLTQGSPAVDAGVDAGVTTDLDGNSRPFALSYDIGAYESPYAATLNLIVGKAGTGGGIITSIPEGLVCGITCTNGFITGTVVTLEATPSISSTFNGWSGGCTGNGACVVTMTEDTLVTATFDINTYVITPTAGLNGSITPSETVTVDYGTDQTFTITANSGYHITDVGVDGESVGITDTYTFANITASHTITATFVVNTYTLSVNKAGTGDGTVALDPPGGVYNHGTVVTLTAEAYISSTFSGWEEDVLPLGAYYLNPNPPNPGGCSGTGDCIVTMTSNKVVTATFDIKTFTITPTAEANGSITPNSSQIVNYGGSITFTITPNTGYHVAEAAVDGVSQGVITSYTFVNVTASHIITASFAVNTYTLTVNKDGTGDGSVELDPGGGVYNHGTVVTLGATPLISSTFGGWAEGMLPLGVFDININPVACSGTGACIVTMTSNKVVTATFDIRTFTITPTAGSNGSITPNSPQTINYGGSITFTITPNTGYHVADVSVDGASQGVITSYTFSNVTTSHTITAAFAINTYVITPTAGANGSITPSTPQTVDYGASQTFTITADSGYRIFDVRVDGLSVAVSGTYTFDNITASHTITAVFVLNTYVITPSAGDNGSITPSTPQTVTFGENQTFTITANTGYHITDVGVDGESVGVTDIYTFTNVTASHVITAAFAINTYVITPTAGSNGSITPGTEQTVNYGASQAFTIAANTGYHITDVGIDGGSVGITSSYAFVNVTATHTITASFEINTYTLSVNRDGTGDGTVDLDPTGGVYAHGTVVTLTATPFISSTFSGWLVTSAPLSNIPLDIPNGSCSGVGDCVIAMIENKIVTATFTLNTYVITPTVEITTDGAIVISREQENYNYGDVITLTAVPAFSWYFTGWTGDIVSNENPITMTFRSDIAVTANFGTRYLYLPLSFTVGPMILTPDKP